LGHWPSSNNACPQECGGKGLRSVRTTPLHRATSAAKEERLCGSGSAASGMQNVVCKAEHKMVLKIVDF